MSLVESSLFGGSKSTNKKSKRLKRKKKRKIKFSKRRNSMFPAIPDGISQIIIDKTDKKESSFNKDYEIERGFGTQYKYVCHIHSNLSQNIPKAIANCFNIFGKIIVKAKTKQQISKQQFSNLIYIFIKVSPQSSFIIPKEIINLVYQYSKLTKICQLSFCTIQTNTNMFKSLRKTKRILRELRILRLLKQHENIVELIDLIPPANTHKFTKLSLVFNFMSTDLKKILTSKQYFTNLQIKYILYQILLSVRFMHTCGIVHRNLNPSNILLNNKCTVQICDFQKARGINEITRIWEFIHKTHLSSQYLRHYPFHMNKTNFIEPELSTNCPWHSFHCGNQCYSAPEQILIMNTNRLCLSYSMDVWSIGCIFAELLQMHPSNCSEYTNRKMLLYPCGFSEILSPKYPCGFCTNVPMILHNIFAVIGTPTSDEIVKFKNKNIQKLLRSMHRAKKTDFKRMLPATSQTGLELLTNMLKFDVNKRINVEEALMSSYFDHVRDRKFELKHRKIKKFAFDMDVQIDEMTLRALILDEIIYFNHDWKKRLKQQYKKKAKKLKQLYR